MSGIAVMKPETRERPFSRPGWLFELKYDGYRMLAERRGGAARLLYRSGRDATAVFPELARAVAALPCDVILDGEAAVLDAAGRPVFQLLQRRGQRSGRIDAERAAAATPVTFFVFDLLALDGWDLRPLPLTRRRDFLRRCLDLAAPLTEAATPLRLVDAVEERGEDLYAAVVELGLEGVVGKRGDSAYKGGASADWLKVRVDQTADFAVIGFEPEGPSGLRNLHLGARHEAGWDYVGPVGSGLAGKEVRQIRARLERARRPHPVAANAPAVRSAVWVEPELVCEVRYKEHTDDGRLRQPVFLRLRDDKRPEECVLPGDLFPPLPAAGRAMGEGGQGGEAPDEEVRPVAFTNLDKIFWPDEGYTKGDLIAYYRTIAPWLLPYLRDRPLVLDRFPDGITGKSFFQKQAPELVAGRLRTVQVRDGGNVKTTDFFLVDDVEGLLFLVNLGAIPLHVWSSRAPDLGRPDWCVVDLDPKGAPFASVVRIAREVRALCEEIGLPSFAKTSGGSGLHVLLPLGGQCDHEQSRQLAELLARIVADRLPEIATTARAIPARRGRVYVDALQNGRGKLLAAPWSARPRPGATVSTPLDWSEVGPRLDPARFTIRTVPQRMKRRGEDPLLPILSLRPDLMEALSRLAALV